MKLRCLTTRDPGFEDSLEKLTRFEPGESPQVREAVRGILADVRARGDAAVLDYAQRFDGVNARSLAELEIPAEELRAALSSIAPQTRAALEVAHGRIRAFHEKQLQQSWDYTEPDGTKLGQRVTPLERVGLYVPGGKAAYPSSVLMNAVPARVAGVRLVVMVSPNPDKVVLAAAALAGVDRVLAIGGAQAVGALAYGTGSVPRVDKIVGPGNVYVAEAKRQVFGQVGIDMIAGPSEILVIADGRSPADWAAMDLFSQAEHDENAQAILLSPDPRYLDSVAAAISRLLEEMPRKETIAASLGARGALIETRDLDEPRPTASRPSTWSFWSRIRKR
jgi:histidinol dehydrogenase